MGGQDVVVARWPLVSDDRPDSGSRLAERIYLILLIDRLCANHVWQSTPPSEKWLVRLELARDDGCANGHISRQSSNPTPLHVPAFNKPPLLPLNLPRPPPQPLLKRCKGTHTGRRPLFTTPYHNTSRLSRNFDHRRHRQARRRASSTVRLGSRREAIRINSREGAVGMCSARMASS